jgi:hypothetical protein
MYIPGRSARYLVLLLAVLISESQAIGAPSDPERASTPVTESGPESPRDMEKRIHELEEKVRELEAAIQALRTAPAGGDAARLAELDRKLELLTEEIERLRLGEAATPASGPAVRGLGPAASKVYQVKQGVSIGGYGEMVYQKFDARRDDGSASGLTDTLDLLRGVLYFGYKWNDRFLVNSEVEFEHATTGEGGEERGEVSLEFAYLDFLFRKGLNARAGLLLVPMGLINEAHEPPVFFGVLRPAVEQLILPTTWRENGAGLFGDFGKFSYRVYLLAGLDAAGFSSDQGIREGRQEGSQSKAEDLALAGRVDWVAVPGLLAGAALYSGDSGQGQLPKGARVTLWDVHAQYQWRGMELRGLAASGSIDDVRAIDAFLQIPAASDPAFCSKPGGPDPECFASVGEKFGGWYIQAGWDVLSTRHGGTASLSPFARYEALDTQERVPGGFLKNQALDRRLLTAGVVWKPIPQVAVKADFQNARNGAGTGVDQFNVGLGWLF